MPQDGSNNYQYPPGTPGIPDQTIESEAYNTFLDDLVTNDLNIPRPIHRGGTNATTAHQALINLKGEEAMQQVTNYDTFPFVAGSFYSDAGATSAPTAGAYTGICYLHPVPGWVTVEARSLDDATNPGTLWVRQKRSSVWSAWTQQPSGAADLDARYVNTAGDTMTGAAIFSNDLTVQGDLYTQRAAGPTGIVKFGNSGTKYLYFDGSKFALTATLAVGGNIEAGTVTATSHIATSDSGLTISVPAGQYARYSSSVAGVRTWLFGTDASGTYTVVDGSYGVRYAITTSGKHTFTGDVELGQGFFGRQGVSGGYSPSRHNFFYNPGGGQIQTWVDGTYTGDIQIASDYRIKKDVTGLPTMWDTVKALRPIKYSQAQFSPPSHIKYVAQETLKARKEAEEFPNAAPREVNAGPLYENDDTERWGFIAHELQETLTPSAATGVKDSPDTVQSPNPFTVIAALTKALQEAMARIEALENGVLELSK
jgi:hypothetical protein